MEGARPSVPRLQPVIQWLIAGVSSKVDAGGLLDELCRRLVDIGLPLWRASYNVHTLHAEVYVRNVVWTAASGSSSELVKHFDLQRPIFRDSPVAQIYQGSPPIRRRLRGPGAVLDYPICEEMGQQGATDYFIMPLSFSDGRKTYFSVTTASSDGFSEQDIADLVELSPYLALRLELESAYFATSSLLQLYLGTKAATRILDGQFRRGQGQPIEAAVFYCDLRNFTEMTARSPSDELIETLDQYFEITSRALHAGGGVILKFIGDAVLAIFDFADVEPRLACSNALNAAFKVQQYLEERSEEFPDRPSIRVGIALHTGSVFFGNVGGSERLDFTVIGPTINEACRLEPLCKKHGVNVVMSEQFKNMLDVDGIESIGHYRVQGVDDLLEVFTISPLADRH